ncbi:MAG: serine/threonine-protein kinase, partial [Schlesneria sp.]
MCHPRDLRRARGRVRRLSFDLPAFDSVWIDSLVQLRLLTPYQAKQLEIGQGESLRVGPFVAIDELGRSKHGSTILARRLNRRDRCVVRRERLTSDRGTDVVSQMGLVLERVKGFVHPYLVVPNEILPTENNELVLVSRYVPGLPLNELLVRRGRFPATVVVEIGRQLLEGLAALNARSVVHGDIRLSNIRLTESGLAVLVNGGVRQVIRPHLTIHDAMSIDHYDGMAPELIGTGASATASSELYSLGCVLWQLLAGRPPYVSADPLVKIASHQTQTIDDVRKWAPDTPASLADSIRQLTSPSPSMRPRSFEEVLQHWGAPSSQSRSRIRKFRRLFNSAMPHFSEPTTEARMGNWAWTAAAVLAVAAGLALSYDNGLRNELLNVARNVEAVTHAARNQQGETKPVEKMDGSTSRQSHE